MCRRFTSVFISSISSFLSQLPLSGNKAAFSFQSCPSIVGSGVRIQWSCRCPLLPPPILSTQSQSFFSVPEFSSGFSSAFRPARLSSVVGFVRLLVRTVFSLVLCHDAVFGWSRRPSFPLLLLFSTTIFRIQPRTVHSRASSPPSQRPLECRARRIEGLSTCLTLRLFSG